MLEIKVPASTSNLGPGFDTLGLALQLYLRVRAEAAQQLRIEVHGRDAHRVPKGKENLVWRAMEEVAEAAQASLPPQLLTLDSEIPLCRGLGSSGAAIAAGLWIANEVLGTGMEPAGLLKLGATIEGHPENVAASLFGGLTINCTTDDGVISSRVEVAEWPQVVLLIPNLEVPTAHARRVLPESLPYPAAVASVQRATLLLEAFHTGRFDWLRTAMDDLLHQPYRKQLIPGFDAIVAAGYDAGAAGVCLSGSGSTLLAFVQEDPHAVAQAMRDAATEAGLVAETKVVGVADAGVEIRN